MDKGLSSRISNLLLIIFLAVIVLLSVIKLVFPADDYRQQITQHLTDIAGQPVEVIGTLEWYLSPFPSLFANSIVARDSGIALEEVSISFSLLDLIFLKATPTDIEIEKVASILNLKSVPLFEKAIIHFNDAGTTPDAFELEINRSSAHSDIDSQDARVNSLNLKVQADIHHVDTNRFHIEGMLKNTGKANQNHPILLKDTLLQLDLAKGEAPKTHQFDLKLTSGSFILTSNGTLKVLNDVVSIALDQLNTPNMALSGKSIWHRKNASIQNTLHGKRVAIPAICFKEPYRSNNSYCYDLAMLMMLPGESTLQTDTLEIHQQTLQNLDISWGFSGQKIVIHRAKAEAMGGQLNLTGALTLPSNQWDVNLLGQNIEIEAFLRAIKHKPQLFGTADISLKGHGKFDEHPFKHHKIAGEVVITDGKTELFNLEKELCTQVKGVVVTNSIATPFKRLSITIDEENNHLKIPYFISELDGAIISGQGEVGEDQTVNLAMNVKLNKEEWPLCKLPRALTGIEWPLTCNKQPDGPGNCNINLKQMGLSALLLADDPERQDKAKLQLQELKESDKVKKVLSRLEKWLEE